ncbi:glycosyltransferase [Sphingobium boeckii]|uniref:Glycosyltransferase involved in cell wall biosynthesis n=1 Tax=Sphingobium boeckii TaxID=1082345 RepID=A0A7W9AGC4_9SPHN|nr:glycosyltransferase [Sphingobium boeckii]MBB5685063.1 glycosyltransferase involved in cell wall biosynthesis [Sphingobium boeckii]
MSRPVHILHCHSSFSLGGKEARAVRLMNAFGDKARHSIVSGVPEALDARTAIAPGIQVEFPQHAPPLTGTPSVKRYDALARYMRRFDLVLTYNWGAMDTVMARRVFTKGTPPLIHHEDGFNADEADGLKRDRNLFRRIALPAAQALVVPSQKLEAIARKTWKQPDYRIHRISNGIDVTPYGRSPRLDAIPGFTRRKGDLVIGTMAGLRSVKDLPRLVRAFAGQGDRARLVIVGEGPERTMIEGEAARLGVGARVHMPGFVARPERYVGLFDIFALSSRSEQCPIAVMEAMAAGLPVVSPDVGDVMAMVAPENRPLIGEDIGAALAALSDDRDLRLRIGAANQIKARADYHESVMIAAYARLYGAALGQSARFSG